MEPKLALVILCSISSVWSYGTYYKGQENYLGDEDGCCEEYCYALDEQPYIYFATKSAYQLVHADGPNQHREPSDLFPKNQPGCAPIQFWSINRHGTRLPGKNAIVRLKKLEKLREDVIKNYQGGGSIPDRGRLCREDLDLLKSWRWNESITVEDANSITEQGFDDLRFLARRYRKRFASLLNVSYSESNYNFKYTDTDRTSDSFKAFVEGLFENNAHLAQGSVDSDGWLLKPYKNCKIWQKEVEDNPDTSKEYRRFKASPEYRLLVRNVFKRLGFGYTLNESIVEDMYDMCRFEKAWYVDRPSPWCSAFTKEQLKLMEFAEDLDYYYHTGHGHEMNRKIGCPPLKDLYERFEKSAKGTTDVPKATVYFTHSAMMQLFLSAMGVAKDEEPLTADNRQQQSRRKWRTSLINPFATNLAAVLYRCDDIQSQAEDRHKVMFLLNEQPVDFPGCSGELCSWKTVKNALRHDAENCNLIDFCKA